MSQAQHNTSGRKYEHLNSAERKVIQRLNHNGKSEAEIGRILCRDRSTISRELKRGSVLQRKAVQSTSKRIEVPLYTETAVYFAAAGEREYRKRRAATGAKCKIGECLPFLAYLEEKMLGKEKWSPDATAGEARNNKRFDYIPSTKTLYNWIDLGLCKVKNLDLLIKVKRRAKSPRVRSHKRLMGISIDQRPASVNRREEFGHWEGDGIVGAHQKGFLISLVERCSGFGLLFDVKDRDASHIVDVIHGLKADYGNEFGRLFRSITFDNGTEFSSAAALCDDTLKIYYAHPYTSWERPVNENWNGIVRRFLPKGKTLDALPDGLVPRIASMINTLPRKRFAYRCPLDLLNSYLSVL